MVKGGEVKVSKGYHESKKRMRWITERRHSEKEMDKHAFPRASTYAQLVARPVK
jgi:hypothetical protein